MSQCENDMDGHLRIKNFTLTITYFQQPLNTDKYMSGKNTIDPNEYTTFII